MLLKAGVIFGAMMVMYITANRGASMYAAPAYANSRSYDYGMIMHARKHNQKRKRKNR